MTSTSRHSWIRRGGLLLAIVCLLLGWLVSPWFTVAAAAIWIGLITAGGGSCPLGACAIPNRPRREP
jgi:hypothetical protein